MTAPTPEAPASEPAQTVPDWITDPDAVESIALGFYELPDSPTGDSA